MVKKKRWLYFEYNVLSFMLISYMSQTIKCPGNWTSNISIKKIILKFLQTKIYLYPELFDTIIYFINLVGIFLVQKSNLVSIQWHALSFLKFWLLFHDADEKITDKKKCTFNYPSLQSCPHDSNGLRDFV